MVNVVWGKIVMSSDENEGKEKVDIKSLVNIIPPASARKEKMQSIKEKRVKVKKNSNLEEGFALMSSSLASSLQIKECVELSIKGKRVRVSAIIQDNVNDETVYMNGKDMEKNGINDNSVVTIRKC